MWGGGGVFEEWAVRGWEGWGLGIGGWWIVERAERVVCEKVSCIRVRVCMEMIAESIPRGNRSFDIVAAVSNLVWFWCPYIDGCSTSKPSSSMTWNTQSTTKSSGALPEWLLTPLSFKSYGIKSCVNL